MVKFRAENHPTQDICSPLLVFKLGVLGCAPLDFPEQLAGYCDAKFISSDMVRKSIMDEAAEMSDGDRKKAQPVRMGKIRTIAINQAAAYLRSDQDVVLDMYFNTVKSRGVPKELAKRSDALSVALSIHTPFSLIAQRIRRWTEEDAFVIPLANWEEPPMRVARAMMGQVVRPAGEGIDYVFNLDGSTDTDGLLEQFEENIERFGLAERYEPN